MSGRSEDIVAVTSTVASLHTTLSGKQSTLNPSGKVKQTRKRQRLSCVECTKRRQKCDRQIPCGLCISRGIPDLCRWEPIMARPAPQRPPVPPTTAESATIEALTARITALEEALKAQNGGATAQGGSAQAEMNSQSSTSSRGSPDHSSTSTAPPEPCREWESVFSKAHCDNGPRALIDPDVQVAATALAQLSMAPRAEYIGGGTLVCALNKLGDVKNWRLTYPSTLLTSPSYSTTPKMASDGLEHPALFPIRNLVTMLPPRAEVERFLQLFFSECNWQFGISEIWFRASMQKMWEQLSLRCTPTCRLEGGCPACKEEVNPHWLSLLFSIFALVPASGQTAEDSGKYFVAAMTARRLVDEILLASSVYSTSESAVHGSVLSCIAAVLLAIHQADRGRLSESWKLIGNATRSAQAIGLHRNPRWGKWEKMHKVEIELRVTAWWMLVMADRLYSFILGRPPMVSNRTSDVLDVPTDIHSDGSTNVHGMFYRAFIALSGVIAEGAEKCLGLKGPSYAAVLEMDHRFEEWEAQLHPSLRWRTSLTKSESSTPEESSLPDDLPNTPCPERQRAYQKYTLAGWYLTGLMNIHRPYLMHAPILPNASSDPSLRTGTVPNPSRERCIETAIELVRLMTTFHDESRGWLESRSINSGTLSYFVFDGAVALAGALSQVPPHPRSEECLALLEKSMRVLKDISDATQDAQDGQGDMARRAMTVLKALRRAGGWGVPDEEKGDLILLQDMLEKERTRLRQQQQQNPQDQYQYPRQRSNGDPVSGFAASASQTASLGSADLGRDFPVFSAEYAPTSTAFGMYSSTPGGSSYLPDVTTHPRPLPNLFASNQPGPSVMASESASPAGLPSPGPFNGNGMSYAGLASPSPFYTGLPQPVQSMLMPFDVLQGVQPDAQGTMNIDVDWARLAGMESWYSNGVTSAMGGSDIL